MNFFEQQDQARRKTGRLIALFVVATILIVVSLYAVFVALGAWMHADPHTYSWWQPELFIVVTIGGLAAIGLGSATKTMALRQGGHVVAEDLGGRPLDRETDDFQEQQLLNVVEEMAIASGTPVPTVYVLEEDGINAFAAGYSPDDAVIGVTRGCIEHLSREELQGVIAHEFSHILNGDMRMNINLIGILHGILLIGILGRMVVRAAAWGGSVGGGRDRGKGRLILLLGGLALIIIGSAGFLCGRLIKSAVSRQREYLADASAVQFTRNPDGIAGALKKIGGFENGAEIEAPKAEESSHMFFGNALKSNFFGSGAFSTHPPLEERVKRIDPSFAGEFPKVEAPEPDGLEAAAMAGFRASQAANTDTDDPLSDEAIADELVNQVGSLEAEHVAYGAQMRQAIPAPLIQAVHDPLDAVAVTYGLLFDTDDAMRERQLEALKEVADDVVVDETVRMYPKLKNLDPRMRLPLVDLATPALRDLSPEQADQFRQGLRQLIEADDQLTLFQYALEKIVEHRLDHIFGTPDEAPKYGSFSEVEEDVVTVLSALAHVGYADEEGARQALREGLRLFESLSDDDLDRFALTDGVDAAALDTALDRLALTKPKLREQVIDACAHCVLLNEHVTTHEAELVRVVAEAMDCPVPPFLASFGMNVSEAS